MIHWLVTNSIRLARTHAPSAITGWRLHAVEGPAKASFDDVRNTRALCGALGRHGWALDLFIERKCARCERMEAAKSSRRKVKHGR